MQRKTNIAMTACPFTDRPKRGLMMLLACAPLALAVLAGSAWGQVATAAPTADEKAKEKNDLPDPKSILARYVEAIGGEETIRQYSSTEIKGRMEMPGMGASGQLHIRAAKPNRILMTMSMPGMGEMRQGYDGKVGWIMSPMTGATLMEEEQLAEMQIEADYFAPLNYDKHYKSLETVEKTKFNDTEAYHIRAVRQTGNEISLYFAVDSGLKLGERGQQETGFGKADITTTLTEYEEFGGIKLPRVTTIETMGMRQIMRLEEVKFDTVDDDAFKLPEQIKRLVDRKKEAEKETDETDDEGATS